MQLVRVHSFWKLELKQDEYLPGTVDGTSTSTTHKRTIPFSTPFYSTRNCAGC